MAQLAEQLICNQQVIGSSPIIGFLDGFPSGQRGQTVNLLATLSVVRIHLHPFERKICNQQVIGSSPIIGFLDGFPSGQRGQTVNLLATLSVVRIHLHPFERKFFHS